MSKIEITVDGMDIQDMVGDYQATVEEFMEAADQNIVQSCGKTFDPKDPQIELYMKLVQEEFDETLDAYSKGDTVELADGLADMVWVIMGLASSVGIPFDDVWEEVKASNMSKVVDGKLLKREDGKVMKPDTYFKPDLNAVLFW
jgi:predicted HAD superfamily Cof-like phosphohydrolase